MLESEVVAEWLHDTLSGDAALMALVTGVYDTLAPQNSQPPFVVFQEQSGRDVLTVAARRIMYSGVWLAKGIVKGGSFVPLLAIMARVDALLGHTSGTTDEGAVLSCTRRSTVRYVETAGGVAYRHLGALFDVIAQEA